MMTPASNDRELTDAELDRVFGGGGSTTDKAPRETIAFEYGGIRVQYVAQMPNGAE